MSSSAMKQNTPTSLLRVAHVSARKRRRQRSPSPSPQLTNSGPAPYDVAQKASVIISMVPTGKHVKDVYVGEGSSVMNALKSMNQEQRAATLCIDQSTIEQSVSKAVALQLRGVGADLIDAPVSGGTHMASIWWRQKKRNSKLTK